MARAVVEIESLDGRGVELELAQLDECLGWLAAHAEDDAPVPGSAAALSPRR
jgi:hypothetical protein